MREQPCKWKEGLVHWNSNTHEKWINSTRQQNQRLLFKWRDLEIFKIYFKILTASRTWGWGVGQGCKGLYPGLPQFLLSRACSHCPSLGSLQRNREWWESSRQGNYPVWPDFPVLCWPCLQFKSSHGSTRARLSHFPAFPAPHKAGSIQG